MAPRILIVDDNAHFLQAARTLLEREGMRVVAVAATSAEAIRHAHELQPDVMLVDVDLGDESGFDLARRLTEVGSGIAGRVVLISAYPESDLRDIIDASPAIAFLPKSQLSSDAIRQLLGEEQGGAGDDASA